MLSDYSLESILAYTKDGTDYILKPAPRGTTIKKQIARWSQQIQIRRIMWRYYYNTTKPNLL